MFKNKVTKKCFVDIVPRKFGSGRRLVWLASRRVMVPIIYTIHIPGNWNYHLKRWKRWSGLGYTMQLHHDLQKTWCFSEKNLHSFIPFVESLRFQEAKIWIDKLKEKNIKPNYVRFNCKGTFVKEISPLKKNSCANNIFPCLYQII